MATRTLHFASSRILSQLYASRPQNLQRIEEVLKVTITSRDNWLEVEGADEAIVQTEKLFEFLNKGREQGMNLADADVEHILMQVAQGHTEDLQELFTDPVILKIREAKIVPKTLNQKRYLQFIAKHDIVFGVGPAGTGKTYLAVAAALQGLYDGKFEKMILTRPAVESGEALGFLPGDLEEKILPYLRPLYDAMDDILGREDAARLIDKGVIEIAPLAYMRGRTLSNAFIILDEAQNTTHEQMMMFLTRLGNRSKIIVTGDITQVDLPFSKISGLKQAVHALVKVDGIKLFYFEPIDVVRHPLVQKIITAYEHYLAEKSR